MPIQSPPNRAGTVPGNFTCIACGYNLRGQGFDARCPECGLPVDASFTKMRHAPAMLWRVRVAAGLMLLPLALVLSSDLMGWLYNARPLWFSVAMFPLVFASPMVGMMVLLTSPVPAGPARFLRIARLVTLLVLAGLLLWFLVEQVDYAIPVLRHGQGYDVVTLRTISPHLHFPPATALAGLVFAWQAHRLKMRAPAYANAAAGFLLLGLTAAAIIVESFWPSLGDRPALKDLLVLYDWLVPEGLWFALAVLGLIWSGWQAVALREEKVGRGR